PRSNILTKHQEGNQAVYLLLQSISDHSSPCFPLSCVFCTIIFSTCKNTTGSQHRIRTPAPFQPPTEIFYLTLSHQVYSMGWSMVSLLYQALHFIISKRTGTELTRQLDSQSTVIAKPKMDIAPTRGAHSSSSLSALYSTTSPDASTLSPWCHSTPQMRQTPDPDPSQTNQSTCSGSQQQMWRAEHTLHIISEPTILVVKIRLAERDSFPSPQLPTLALGRSSQPEALFRTLAFVDQYMDKG
ncbi:hypothetical protein V8F06_014413, partial [Rhypophila decipiens]